MELELGFNELDKNVQVVLMCVNNSSMQIKDLPNYEICGLKMKDYVRQCFKYALIQEVECNEEDDIIKKAKQCVLSDKKYTMILFSDTPLLKRKTVLEILEYFEMKSLSVLKLTRGYVFETDYLRKVETLYSPQFHYFDEEDFMSCFNLKQLALINDIMQNRIIDYHLKNGVIFKNPQTCSVDVNAVIGEGVMVEQNNVIKGKTIIESGSHLFPNNIINKSIIKSGCKISNSIINNSFIENNCTVNPFCLIENNSLIEENSTIESFCKVSKTVIKKGSTINSFSNVVAKE